ncbi:MAG: TolC family protein, partial [Chitinophagaceae bacterium]|nr:TolC family protein [Chitinophagaceae bacterium]
LDAVAISGNINEFVVNDNPNANFFPKYNLGITLPFSIFGKQSNIKKAAAAQVDMNVALKQDEERRVVKDVLTRYAVYQEKKDVYEFQKRISSELLGAYQKVKEDYAEGVVTELEDVNKAFQAYINQQIEERTAKKDYEVSIIDLEAVTGVPMATVLSTVMTIMESTPN